MKLKPKLVIGTGFDARKREKSEPSRIGTGREAVPAWKDLAQGRIANGG